MLDRIVEAITAERRLTDEIAHELRTPLSVVLAEADLARRTPPVLNRKGLDNIHGAAVRMRDSIDTMLSAARSHSSGVERTTVGEVMRALGLPATAYDGVALAAPARPWSPPSVRFWRTPSVTAPADLTSTWPATGGQS